VASETVLQSAEALRDHLRNPLHWVRELPTAADLFSTVNRPGRSRKIRCLATTGALDESDGRTHRLEAIVSDPAGTRPGAYHPRQCRLRFPMRSLRRRHSAGRSAGCLHRRIPGYENRPGKPSEVSFDRAADEAFALLPTNQPIYLVGESLGTGVATYLAGKNSNDVAGVVLLAPYNKLAAVGQAHMVIIPVALLLRDRFPSEDYLRTFHGPVAMLVGGRDNVIPAKFGRRLYQAYDGPKHLWEFPEGNHGTVMMQPPEVWRQIIEFWESNRRPL